MGGGAGFSFNGTRHPARLYPRTSATRSLFWGGTLAALGGSSSHSPCY